VHLARIPATMIGSPCDLSNDSICFVGRGLSRDITPVHNGNGFSR
jgi:hypothetical protein